MLRGCERRRGRVDFRSVCGRILRFNRIDLDAVLGVLWSTELVTSLEANVAFCFTLEAFDSMFAVAARRELERSLSSFPFWCCCRRG